MAVIEDSSVHRKKSRDDLDEIPTFNVENMQNNTRIINYSRTFMSIIGGVVAGILGFTGLMGFILYFHHGNYYSRTCCEAWVFSSYFDSWNQIILDGILGGLMVYIFLFSWFQFCTSHDDIPYPFVHNSFGCLLYVQTAK
ncbi:hypothetical protein Pfo_015860 [Paulownia fortunei]|nr:hypothetical protein Pfo_015860 [Paulownia fortunei]